MLLNRNPAKSGTRPAPFLEIYSPSSKPKPSSKPRVEPKKHHTAANFQLGRTTELFNPRSTTSEMYRNIEEAGKEQLSELLNSKAQYHSMRNSNRKPHYDLGRDATNYTSTAKGGFQEHDVTGATQVRQTMQNFSKDVRKSHFLFGTDVDPDKPHYSNTKVKSQLGFNRDDQMASHRQEANKTNI